jgi:hypothetical protein
MGSITRGLSNNITTGGVILPAGITNASVSAVTSFANAANPANLVLISTQTASASATISFTTGLDSTYDEYIFKFINIHPATNSAHFSFNGSTDSGSNYNVTKTTSNFRAYHPEDDVTTSLAYEGTFDLAQSTAFQELAYNAGNNNDDNSTGSLTLFNPSSTTYVKHFIARLGYSHTTATPAEIDAFISGYFNTTSAINAIQFKFNTGNIDDGIIKLYGVKKS